MAPVAVAAHSTSRTQSPDLIDLRCPGDHPDLPNARCDRLLGQLYRPDTKVQVVILCKRCKRQWRFEVGG